MTLCEEKQTLCVPCFTWPTYNVNKSHLSDILPAAVTFFAGQSLLAVNSTGLAMLVSRLPK